MDAFQQHRYMRPPPPPAMDPYNHHQPPTRAPVPSHGSWYGNQFQYHPSHSPSPPPQQWGPPPPPQPPPPPGSYPPHPPPYPYPAHPSHHQNHFPPPPPPPPQMPQSYPHHNQEWGTTNWTHHQGWDHSAPHSNEEDWAARARAWADAKTATDNQPPQSQYTPVGRLEEQNHYHDQYSQAVDNRFLEVQHQSHPRSSYQQVPLSPTPPLPQPPVHSAETPFVSSGSASYAPGGHLPQGGRDLTSAADPNAVFHHQGTLPTSSSVHQQEVPSSYSSIAGNEGTSDQSEKSYGHHHMQPSQGVPFPYYNHSTESMSNAADQPLQFAPGFNRENDLNSSYTYHDSTVATRSYECVPPMPSVNTWTASVAPGVAYSPTSPIMLSSTQPHDPSLSVPPSAPGYAVPPFSSFPGPVLQPTMPSTGLPFSFTAGNALPHTAAFSGEYGISGVPERPKKASVPNWLREEIKKAVITNSSVDHPKEETESREDEVADKNFGNRDQADSKSISSARSTEEDDDDEDSVEAARTATINQEIKRVLTEVLLKVTDELFDEIATKVLNEDVTDEVDKVAVISSHKGSPPLPAMLPPNVSAKVLIPAKAKEFESGGAGEKPNSESPGDILGLGNYATDDDEDDEILNSSMPNSFKKDILKHPSVEKSLGDPRDVGTSDNSLAPLEEQNGNRTNLENDISQTSSIGFKVCDNDAVSHLTYNRSRKNGTSASASTPDSTDASMLKGSSGIIKSDLPEDNLKKVSKDDYYVKENGPKPGTNDQDESKKGLSRKDLQKQVENDKFRTDDEDNNNRMRQDEMHSRKEKTDSHNLSKEKTRELSVKSGEKAQESELKKRSFRHDVKEDRKEAERQHRASTKEESVRKRGHTKDKEEYRSRSRHKLANDSSRNKRRRSSSISRGRNSKDSSNYAYDSSDEALDDSRRLPSRKRNLSPSPVKSRRRQVSRSPHSKNSQRRHSPYSSLDSNRRRRSRSKTPVRQKR